MSVSFLLLLFILQVRLETHPEDAERPRNEHRRSTGELRTQSERRDGQPGRPTTSACSASPRQRDQPLKEARDTKDRDRSRSEVESADRSQQGVANRARETIQTEARRHHGTQEPGGHHVDRDRGKILRTELGNDEKQEGAGGEPPQRHQPEPIGLLIPCITSKSREKRYAKSLIDLAKETGVLDVVSADMKLSFPFASPAKELTSLRQSDHPIPDKKKRYWNAILATNPADDTFVLSDLIREAAAKATVRDRERIHRTIQATISNHDRRRDHRHRPSTTTRARR